MQFLEVRNCNSLLAPKGSVLVPSPKTTILVVTGTKCRLGGPSKPLQVLQNGTRLSPLKEDCLSQNLFCLSRTEHEVTTVPQASLHIERDKGTGELLSSAFHPSSSSHVCCLFSYSFLTPNSFLFHFLFFFFYLSHPLLHLHSYF